MVSGCQIGGSTVSSREGYFSWVDEQGRVRYSPIVSAQEPVSAQEQAPPDQPEAPVRARAGDEIEDEFTPADYPDAEELRRRGYVREGERQPYFTWRDASGNVRVTYYQPDTRTDEEKGLTKPPTVATQAKVYRPGDTPLVSEPVAGHDPDAFAILGVADEPDNYLERFSETCCRTLDTQNQQLWQAGREFGVHVTKNSPTHGFLTGQSPYQLIALPREDQLKGKILRLRSYANNGVFVPSVLFLDGELAPTRLVTDLVMEFEPENWHRRGYLEARIPVSAAGDERWMLIFTRNEDLEGQTVVDTRRGPQKIPHVRTGEFGLTLEDAY
ncbi:hypothetical protein GCM10011533_10900 [Streptosporangium jomthongense]|nr:hypothetical protein GCM10011533_10900 [Streptosporangium jomthongense]